MSRGKYFMLVSKLSGHVVGTEGGSKKPGVKLVTCEPDDDDGRLYWYTDALTGTIRNKKTKLCLHIEGSGDAMVNSYDEDETCQKVYLDGTLIKSRDGDRVLDIKDNNSGCNAPLCWWSYNGGSNQQWDCVFKKPKYFLLKGEASGKALDIMGQNSEPGAKICLFDINNQDNQLWYEDRNGLIRSKLNDFVFDSSTDDVTMQPFDRNNPNRCWALFGSFVVQLANPSVVLDVRGEKTCNGATLCAYGEKNSGNQKWSVEYI